MELHLEEAAFTVEDVLSKIPPKGTAFKELDLVSSINGLKYSLDISRATNYHRLRTFEKSTICKCCGAEGNKFVLVQKNKIDQPSLQLFGTFDNKEVLLTTDHIIPRSLGGVSSHNNYQTLCHSCNDNRGNSEFDKDIILSKKRHIRFSEHNKKMCVTNILGATVLTYLKEKESLRLKFRKKKLNDPYNKYGEFMILVRSYNNVYDNILNKRIIATDGRFHYYEDELFL